MSDSGIRMTAQAHERLILEGKETSMAFCPPLPDHPRVIPTENRILSTGCWRGYIGTWELKDGKLYLVSIKGGYRLDGDAPLFADWVTAVLRIPEGEMLHYVHMGFGSVFEFENHIKIENGVVVQERRIDNRDKDFSSRSLGWENLPGSENRFDGDDMD
jgi:hypothetical protein